MKKVFLTAMIAAAFAFSMTACNNNANQEVVEDTIEVEEVCEHNCAMDCQDSTCAAGDCENCEKKGTDECCKVKNGANEGCAHEGCAHEGEACNHECNHECNHAE